MKEYKSAANERKRAESLFLSLKRKFGHGEQYEQIFSWYTSQKPFLMQWIRTKAPRINCEARMAMHRENHVVTIFFFIGNDIVPPRDSIILELYGGKVGPESEQAFYPDTIHMNFPLATSVHFLRIFSIVELLDRIR